MWGKIVIFHKPMLQQWENIHDVALGPSCWFLVISSEPVLKISRNGNNQESEMRLPARAGKEQMVAWGEADGKQGRSQWRAGGAPQVRPRGHSVRFAAERRAGGLRGLQPLLLLLPPIPTSWVTFGFPPRPPDNWYFPPETEQTDCRL